MLAGAGVAVGQLSEWDTVTVEGQLPVAALAVAATAARFCSRPSPS
jgi:hypothetical protein